MDEVYKDEYDIEYICDTIEQMMGDDVLQTMDDWTDGHSWKTWCIHANKVFLKKFEKYCMDFICQTEQDKEMLNKCLLKNWTKYASFCSEDPIDVKW